MLAVSGALPRGDAWAYEVKWDGVRALVAVEGGQVRATSRAGNDLTSGYPELAALSLPSPALLDGELVALVDGVPDFGALQQRMHVRGPAADLVAAVPVLYVPFDVLHVGDRSLLAEAYDTRRAVLAQLLPDSPAALEGDVDVLLEGTRAAGLEGLVAKRRDSPYAPGRRSDHWVKAKHVRRQSAVVVGWQAGEGGRGGGLGSLLLAVHGPVGLAYAGKVGTGFTAATLRKLADLLAPLARDTAPCEVPSAQARVSHWVEPVLVVEVELTAWTAEGRLRHPSYKGLRPDLDPAEVVREL